jgi:hypothetical protein
MKLESCNFVQFIEGRTGGKGDCGGEGDSNRQRRPSVRGCRLGREPDAMRWYNWSQVEFVGLGLSLDDWESKRIKDS